VRKAIVSIDGEKVSAKVFSTSENHSDQHKRAQPATRVREVRALSDAMCSLGAGSRADSDRITCDHRAVLTLAVTDKEIILLDVGSHDEVYR
jgi:hypothetical protein